MTKYYVHMFKQEGNGFLPRIDHSPYKSPVNWIANRYQYNGTEKRRVKSDTISREAKYSIDGHKKLLKQQLKPVPNDVYQRLTVKTYVTNRLDIPEEVKLTRWPENQKHIRGATSYKVPSFDQNMNIEDEITPEKNLNDEQRIYLTIEEVAAISQLQERLLQALSQPTNCSIVNDDEISGKKSFPPLQSVSIEPSFQQLEVMKSMQPSKPDSASRPSRNVAQYSNDINNDATPEKWISSLPTYRLSTRQLKEHKNSLQNQQDDVSTELSDRMVYKSTWSSPLPIKSLESPTKEIIISTNRKEDKANVRENMDPSVQSSTNNNNVAVLLSDIRSAMGKRKLKSYVEKNDANNLSSLEKNKSIEDDKAYWELKQIIDSFSIPVFTARWHDSNFLEICEETASSMVKFERKDMKLLGRGKFAAVYSVPLKLRDPVAISDDKNSLRMGNYAIKVAQFKSNDIFSFSTCPDESEKQTELPSKCIIIEFRCELYALWKISSHRNVIRGIGFVSRPFGLMMECVEGQNLFGLMENEDWQRQTNKFSRVSILQNIINGMSHIHQHQFIHRDIKPHNIIVTKCGGGFCAKIADMGTAFELPYTPFELKYRKETFVGACNLCREPKGTMGYSAPEIINPDESMVAYDYSVDVFAFGIITWELLMTYDHLFLKRNPLSELSPDIAYCRMLEGLRPSLINECHSPDSLSVLISFCWETNPQNRPLAVEIHSQLERICSKL